MAGQGNIYIKKKQRGKGAPYANIELSRRTSKRLQQEWQLFPTSTMKHQG